MTSERTAPAPSQAMPPSLPPVWPLVRRLLAHRSGLFWLNVVVWSVIHSLPVLTGLLVKAIFDALTMGAAAGLNAWTFVAFLTMLNFVRIGTFVGAIFAWSTLWHEIVLLMRRNLLEHLVRAPGSRLMPDSPGEFVSRFRDDVDDVAQVVESIVDVWGLAIYALVAAVVMALVAPGITAAVLVPMLLIVLLTRQLTPLIRAYRRAQREATGRVTSFIGETFAAVQAVKINAREREVVERFRALNETRRRAALRDSLLTEILRSVNINMVNVGTGAILILGAEAMRTGTFTIGDFAMFVTFLPRLTNFMAFVGDMLAQWRRAGVSFERLARLTVDAAPEDIVRSAPLHLHDDAPAAARAPRGHGSRLETLEVRGLTYLHPSSGRGIYGASFALERGSFTVITGRVGSGKTTLVRSLLGLLPRDAGEILWNGSPVVDPASFFVPPHSAYTAQVPRLFSDTLRGNVVQERTGDDDALADAVELAVLTPDVRSLERGLETLVGTRGVKLSGGQVQRSAAARMFMRDADLLVFDDLSSALDVVTEARLWESLFARDATCLVVSTRRAALERADRVVLLDGGRVRATGTLSELLASDAEMRALWEGEG